jgi:hypothetical protein
MAQVELRSGRVSAPAVGVVEHDGRHGTRTLRVPHLRGGVLGQHGTSDLGCFIADRSRRSALAEDNFHTRQETETENTSPELHTRTRPNLTMPKVRLSTTTQHRRVVGVHSQALQPHGVGGAGSHRSKTERRETLSRVQRGTRLSPWPLCGVNRTRTRGYRAVLPIVKSRVTSLRCSSQPLVCTVPRQLPSLTHSIFEGTHAHLEDKAALLGRQGALHEGNPRPGVRVHQRRAPVHRAVADMLATSYLGCLVTQDTRVQNKTCCCCWARQILPCSPRHGMPSTAIN